MLKRNKVGRLKSLGRIVLIPLAAILVAIWVAPSPSTNALSGSSFNAGNIIDDSVFFNPNTMSVADIQYFLSSKVVCDTNGVGMVGGITRAQYAANRGLPTKFTCLPQYRENVSTKENNIGNPTYSPPGSQSASEIIYNVSKYYGINPRAMIVLLQKEQALITDEWPVPRQYQIATGFGCPDTAACDTQYYGFYNQVNSAAIQFKKYVNGPQNYRYKPYQNNTIYWSPTLSCGTTNVYIENRATAALYNYTPYRPNQAALSNLYGTGDGCSAYGNRNFWRYFNDWFGATTGPDYSATILSRKMYSDSSYTQLLTSGERYSLSPNKIVYVKVVAENSGRATWDKQVRLGSSSPIDRASEFNNSWLAPARAASIDQQTVAPGGTATFSFSMKAPALSGSYFESFNLVADGRMWMDAGFRYDIDVTVPRVVAQTDSNHILEKNGARPNSIKKNDFLMSGDNYTTLRISSDGKLVLYSDFLVKWNPNHNNPTATELVLQSDGNLVLYGSSGLAIWASGTNNGSVLATQMDGNLVLYSNQGSAVWSSNTTTRQPHSEYAEYSMFSGAMVFRGQSLQTANRKYTLVMQPDGNLVLYSPTKAIWASGTNNGDLVVMQPDGNLVLYSQSGTPVWASGSAGMGASTFVQPDGNIVTYSGGRAIWASGSAGN